MFRKQVRGGRKMRDRVKPAVVVISYLFLTYCGYSPVKKPFVVNGGKYRWKTVPQSSIRLLNWNIHKEGGRRPWREEFARIVEEKAPNLVTFQEARIEPEFQRIFKKTAPMGWVCSPNTFMDLHDAYAGVLTASPFSPTAARPVLSKGIEPITNTTKAALFTTYTLRPSRKSLLLVNVHALNFQIGLASFKAQMDEIFGIVAEHRGPVILAGDFNTWRPKRMAYVDLLATEAGLARVDFSPETHAIVSRSDIPLDHVYYSEKDLAVTEGSPDVIEETMTSDHKPLFVEFELKNGRRSSRL